MSDTPRADGGHVDVTEVRVRYGETDQMGRAHHAAFVGWFELGRTEMMRRSGLSYARMEKAGIFLPVVRLEVDYLAAAEYEELVRIHSRVGEIRSRRVRFDYTVTGEDDRTLAEAVTTLVCIGGDGRPRRLPDEIRRRLADLAGTVPR